MQNLESLKKIYCSKNFAKQERKRALVVHKRLSKHNWTISGKNAASVPKSNRGSDEKPAKEVARQMAGTVTTDFSASQPTFNSLFAKSYGHGGFYRRNIEDVHN